MALPNHIYGFFCRIEKESISFVYFERGNVYYTSYGLDVPIMIADNVICNTVASATAS